MISESGFETENSYVQSGSCTLDEEENQEVNGENKEQQKTAQEPMVYDENGKQEKESFIEGNSEEMVIDEEPRVEEENNNSLKLPKIENNNNTQQTETVKKPRSDISTSTRLCTSLNIFDQTASNVLKMFSAKNWTDTFFNRIFQKRNSLQERISNVHEIQKRISSGKKTELPHLSTTPVAIKIIEKIDNLIQNSNLRSLPAIESENYERLENFDDLESLKNLNLDNLAILPSDFVFLQEKEGN